MNRRSPSPIHHNSHESPASYGGGTGSSSRMMPLLYRSMLLTASPEAAALQLQELQHPLISKPAQAHRSISATAGTADGTQEEGGQSSPWYTVLMHALCNLWSIFGAVPILACHTATMPIRTNEAAVYRDSFTFLGMAITLTVVRVLCCFLVLPKSHSLSMVHMAVQVLCTCTLFLLFCQESISTRKTKTNGTVYSVMETFAEHTYTLPLLGACRLAGASFRMDPFASAASTAARAQPPPATSSTKTLLGWVDLVLGAASLFVWVVMLCTLPSVDARLQLPVLREEGHIWLQWLLFLLLAFTHLAQDSFTSLGRVGDAVVRGGVLIGEGLGQEFTDKINTHKAEL